MYVVNTRQLEVGMVTAMPVKTKHGQLIIDEGVSLTDSLIARISFYGIECIRIEGEPKPKTVEKAVEKTATAPAPAKTPSRGHVPKATHYQKIKSSPEFHNFQVNFSRSTDDLKTNLSTIISNSDEINAEELLQTAMPLLSEARSSIEVFDMLHNMRTIDDSIYAHSMNVALISNTLGNWLKMSKDDLDALLLAALLHDIGKTKIPTEILDKPGKYTDEEFALVKQHPLFGYQLLASQPGLDPRIKNAVLMHHERCDGSGYPRGLKSDEIDDFAQIIAIADVYDAMTAARSYRAPLCPFQAIAAFEKEGLQKYKPKFILTFLERIATTYQSNRVLLSDGRGANIIMLNKQTLSRPLVQLTDGTCIDLSQTPELSIQSLL